MAEKFVQKHLVGGKGKYMSYLYQQISFLKKKYAKTDSFYDQIQILGEISGIEYGMEESHKHVVDLLVDTKRDISEMITNDEELFHYEINFKKGFIAGIEKTLQQNRYFFSKKVPIFVIGLFENQELLSVFRVLALKTGLIEVSPGDFETDQTRQTNNYFSFSTIIEEFVKTIGFVDSVKFDMALNVVYESKKYDVLVEHLNLIPPVEMFRLNIIRINETYNAGRLFNELVKNVLFNK